MNHEVKCDERTRCCDTHIQHEQWEFEQYKKKKEGTTSSRLKAGEEGENSKFLVIHSACGYFKFNHYKIWLTFFPITKIYTCWDISTIDIPNLFFGIWMVFFTSSQILKFLSSFNFFFILYYFNYYYFFIIIILLLNY